MPPKIAFLLHESPAKRMAGVEIYVLHLARAFMDAGYDVECVHPWPDSGRRLGDTLTREVLGVPFTAFPVPIKPDLAARFMDREVAGALARYLVGQGVDVVHAHHLIGFTGTAIPACKDAGLPVAMSIHDAWFCCNQCHFLRWDGVVCADGPPGAALCAACLTERVPSLKGLYPPDAMVRLMDMRTRYLAGALAQADWLLANSWYTRENLLRAGMLEEKVLLSPLGVPGFVALPRVPRGEGDPLRLGYLGNISLKKGLDILLEALRLLPAGTAELSIHGSPNQPSYHQALMPLLDMPGVYFHGPYGREELPRILAGLDVVVVPSREESYSLVVREAYWAGVPVVAARIPALEEAVDHGHGGLLFPPADAAALAEVLGRLAGAPQELAALAEDVPPVRTIDDDRESLGKLYDDLVSRKKSGRE